MGTLRDTGSTATVLRLLLYPGSDSTLLDLVDFESNSTLTRVAIIRNILWETHRGVKLRYTEKIADS